jgi:nicotinate-nucleotide pyrophosphorylase (carboxylating)
MTGQQDIHSPESEFESRTTRIIEEALFEDIGMGDLTTDAVVPQDMLGHGEFLAKESGIIAGLDIAERIFKFLDPDLQMQNEIRDGARVDAGKIFTRVSGPVAGMLKGERTALNFLQRMSGIATLTRRFVDAVQGTSARITDTRKTAPGLRILDKRAVAIGGGVNHRFGLDDMVLIKDNHIAAAGNITLAVIKCREFLGDKSFKARIEVETKTLAEVREAVGVTGIDRIMLDNFTIEDMEKAVKIINHTVEVEASGNVSLAGVRAIAGTGVDVISVGALTHSVKALDISLTITPARS